MTKTELIGTNTEFKALFPPLSYSGESVQANLVQLMQYRYRFVPISSRPNSKDKFSILSEILLLDELTRFIARNADRVFVPTNLFNVQKHLLVEEFVAHLIENDKSVDPDLEAALILNVMANIRLQDYKLYDGLQIGEFDNHLQHFKEASSYLTAPEQLLDMGYQVSSLPIIGAHLFPIAHEALKVSIVSALILAGTNILNTYDENKGLFPTQNTPGKQKQVLSLHSIPHPISSVERLNDHWLCEFVLAKVDRINSAIVEMNEVIEKPRGRILLYPIPTFSEQLKIRMASLYSRFKKTKDNDRKAIEGAIIDFVDSYGSEKLHGIEHRYYLKVVDSEIDRLFNAIPEVEVLFNEHWDKEEFCLESGEHDAYDLLQLKREYAVKLAQLLDSSLSQYPEAIAEFKRSCFLNPEAGIHSQDVKPDEALRIPGLDEILNDNLNILLSEKEIRFPNLDKVTIGGKPILETPYYVAIYATEGKALIRMLNIFEELEAQHQQITEIGDARPEIGLPNLITAGPESTLNL